MSFHLGRGFRKSLVVIGTTLVCVAPSTAAMADKIVVLRDVPPRSAVHTAPPGEPTEVKTSPKDMVLGLVPNGQELSDDQVAGIFAQVQNPAGGGIGGPGLNAASIVEEANSRAGLTGSPDGGLSSVSRLGSNLSGTVNSSVNQSVGQIAPTIQNALPGSGN